MIEIKLCPICQSTDWYKSLRVADHFISKETFQLIECKHCTFVATSPQPNEEILPTYYQSDNYISHSNQATNLINFIYLIARNISLRWKLRLIKNLKPVVSLLDIGCGTGSFLQIAKEHGTHVSGVEPNDEARKKAEGQLNQIIFNSLDKVQGCFDVITLWHVLEHVPDLNKSIKKINDLLTKDGYLLIAVPNHASEDSKKYGFYWAGYDAPRHLWHFNQKSMALLLQKHGLKVEKKIPMKLDAYYVSMLSEKYKKQGKNGLMSLLNGIISGLSSNFNARKSGEYSSLIYIARK